MRDAAYAGPMFVDRRLLVAQLAETYGTTVEDMRAHVDRLLDKIADAQGWPATKLTLTPDRLVGYVAGIISHAIDVQLGTNDTRIVGDKSAAWVRIAADPSAPHTWVVHLYAGGPDERPRRVAVSPALLAPQAERLADRLAGRDPEDAATFLFAYLESSSQCFPHEF